MSIKQLQKDIRHNGGYILSDGTCNLQHLLPKAYDLLTNYNIQAKKLKNEILECFDISKRDLFNMSLFQSQYYSACGISYNNEEAASYSWNEDIYNFFNNIAPNGYYFGGSEGDGACVGWFKYEKEDQV